VASEAILVLANFSFINYYKSFLFLPIIAEPLLANIYLARDDEPGADSFSSY
jgi:hypothetical protein